MYDVTIVDVTFRIWDEAYKNVFCTPLSSKIIDRIEELMWHTTTDEVVDVLKEEMFQTNV